MTHTVAELAALVGGQLHGDGSRPIVAALPLEEATPDSITFIACEQYRSKLEESGAGAVLIPRTLQPPSIPSIEVDDPLAAILEISNVFTPPVPRPRPGIDSRAVVDPSATIGEDCYVGPLAVIESDVILGEGCVIHPHAVIGVGSWLGRNVEIFPHAVLHPRTIVGDRTLVHSGAVIGTDGFGYRQKDGISQKIQQLGNVQLGSDVEIGANTTIDRAMLGSTCIGDGTKIDNQVMIAHNCRIGAHNVIVGQAGMAGSCTTGDFVMIGGQVGIAEHVNIGARAILGGHSGVYTDIPEGEHYLGVPARPVQEAKRIHVVIERLPRIAKQLAEVRKHLGLESKTERPRMRIADCGLRNDQKAEAAIEQRAAG